jgi:hypothetical protein
MALIEMLNLCHAADQHTINPDTTDEIVPLSKLIQQVRKDRRKYRLMIEPDGVGTAEKYLSMQYASDSVTRSRHPRRCISCKGHAIPCETRLAANGFSSR